MLYEVITGSNDIDEDLFHAMEINQAAQQQQHAGNQARDDESPGNLGAEERGPIAFDDPDDRVQRIDQASYNFV